MTILFLFIGRTAPILSRKFVARQIEYRLNLCKYGTCAQLCLYGSFIIIKVYFKYDLKRLLEMIIVFASISKIKYSRVNHSSPSVVPSFETFIINCTQ